MKQVAEYPNTTFISTRNPQALKMSHACIEMIIFIYGNPSSSTILISMNGTTILARNGGVTLHVSLLLASLC